MKTLLSTLLIFTFAFSAHAQVEFMPNNGNSFYVGANENSASAGFQFNAINAGVAYSDTKGQEIMSLESRIAPTFAQAGCWKFFAGLQGRYGYVINRQLTKASWSAVYGVRVNGVEISTGHLFQYGTDYAIPVNVRLYLK